MLESILADIDAEIVRLKAVKAILTSGTQATPATIRKRGRPAKTETAMSAPKPSPKRRTMSADARERIRQGQVKR